MYVEGTLGGDAVEFGTVIMRDEPGWIVICGDTPVEACPDSAGLVFMW